MGGAALAWLPEAVCLAAGAAAVITDLRAYRIPNWLTGSCALAGVLANLVAALLIGADVRSVMVGVAVGGATLFMVSGALGAAGLMGMGDVKLLGAIGLCVRWPNAVAVFLYTAIAGGLVAIAIAVRRGKASAVVRNLSGDATLDAKRSPHRMPYALAIFIGAAWAIAAAHVRSLALL